MSFKLGRELLPYATKQGKIGHPAGTRRSGFLMEMRTELRGEVLQVSLTGAADLNASHSRGGGVARQLARFRENR